MPYLIVRLPQNGCAYILVTTSVAKCYSNIQYHRESFFISVIRIDWLPVRLSSGMSVKISWKIVQDDDQMSLHDSCTESIYNCACSGLSSVNGSSGNFIRVLILVVAIKLYKVREVATAMAAPVRYFCRRMKARKMKMVKDLKVEKNKERKAN